MCNKLKTTTMGSDLFVRHRTFAAHPQDSKIFTQIRGLNEIIFFVKLSDNALNNLRRDNKARWRLGFARR